MLWTLVYNIFLQVSIKDTAAKNPESSLSKAMANLFNSKEFADFTFLINGKPVQAHKYVLAGEIDKRWLQLWII